MKTLRTHLPMGTTTLAWLLLCALSVLSVGLAAGPHSGLPRLALALLVAAVAWVKARILLRHYLEVQQARPVFARLRQGFALQAPLGQAVSARSSGWPQRPAGMRPRISALRASSARSWVVLSVAM